MYIYIYRICIYDKRLLAIWRKMFIIKVTKIHNVSILDFPVSATVYFNDLQHFNFIEE